MLLPLSSSFRIKKKEKVSQQMSLLLNILQSRLHTQPRRNKKIKKLLLLDKDPNSDDNYTLNL